MSFEFIRRKIFINESLRINNFKLISINIDKKTSLVVKANATFLNSNNKEKAKENEAYLEIKTKKDSVKDKAMILENLEFDPLEKSAKNSFNKISIEDNEGGFAKANLVVSEDSKFKTIRESSDKFEIFKVIIFV